MPVLIVLNKELFKLPEEQEYKFIEYWICSFLAIASVIQVKISLQERCQLLLAYMVGAPKTESKLEDIPVANKFL